MVKPMTKVARYGKFTAKPGEAENLVNVLLSAAADLADDPGCEVYLVNRQQDDPNTIWVTEIWRDQDAVNASLESLKDDPNVAQAMALIESAQMIELDPQGGKS